MPVHPRRAGSFGHIAHGDRNGFYAAFFRDLGGKAAFLDQTVRWIPCGGPAWTHSDIEHAVIGRLKAARLLDAYRALRAAEIEGAERAAATARREIRRQRATDARAHSAGRPALRRPARRNTAARRSPEQHSLF